jgi:hypothetical protein
MAQYLKTDLWKKSYLLEFYKDGKAAEPEEAFTFSVPPESEELTYPQRKTETKTFGGLHVDDYGADAVKIVLSGSTINQALKRIYNPKRKGQDDWLTGEEEVYRLRDLLKDRLEYGDDGKITSKKIMLYDLSKTSYINGGAQIKNYWRVFPGDYQIRRSKDRPFTYNYRIEFTAVDDDAQYNENILAPKLGFAKAAVDALKKSVKLLKENKVLDAIDGVNTFLDELSSSLNDVTSILDAYTEALTGYIDRVTGFVENVNTIISIPVDTTNKVLNIGLEFMNAGLRLMKSVEKVSRTMQAMGTGEYWANPETLKKYGMTADEYADTWMGIGWDMENDANTIAAYSKSNELPAEIVPGQPPGGGTGRQTAIMVYGYYSVPLKDTDTLEGLAAGHAGNPDSAIDIAAYNGIASLDELNPGDPVKIPVTKKSGGNTNNRIYARPGDRDNYGRDISLDEDGRVKASASGDFKLTGGVDNLSQAVLLRLRESVNKRIRLNAYGIKTNISDPDAGTAYILSSIDLTVRNDPRVKAVDNIRFAGTGDGLNVAVDYRDINGSSGNAKGRA